MRERGLASPFIENNVIPQLRTLPRDRRGLSEENLKRHILAISRAVDTPQKASSAPASRCLLSNDPQFQVFGGETTPIPLRPRLKDYKIAAKA